VVQVGIRLVRNLTENIEKHWTCIVYSGVVDTSMWQWLIECPKGQVSYWGMWGYPRLELFFEYPSDAMLFKLTYQ
jgi:hypothetical protein